LDHKIQHHKYPQDQFFKQWFELKEYRNHRGTKPIGDMSVCVALDSAEVWSRPEMFYLDGSGKPTVVPRVSPDYFSETGQLWGSPLYGWDVMANNGCT
jgi:4-alpha-glucanotransferase